jgi:hypothetical protein
MCVQDMEVDNIAAILFALCNFPVSRVLKYKDPDANREVHLLIIFIDDSAHE